MTKERWTKVGKSRVVVGGEFLGMDAGWHHCIHQRGGRVPNATVTAAIEGTFPIPVVDLACLFFSFFFWGLIFFSPLTAKKIQLKAQLIFECGCCHPRERLLFDWTIIVGVGCWMGRQESFARAVKVHIYLSFWLDEHRTADRDCKQAVWLRAQIGIG